MEKVNDSIFIFISFLLNFCRLNNILSTILSSVSTINFLNPAKPKLSNNNKSFLG